jgi:hypothetical protein
MSNEVENNKNNNLVKVGSGLAAGAAIGAVIAFSTQPTPPTTECLYKPANIKFCVLGNVCPPPPNFENLHYSC